MNIYIDSKMSDDDRRQKLYQGSLVAHAPTPSALKLCRLAQELIEDAFPVQNPLKIQDSLPAEKCAEILGRLKPHFIHHPQAKEYLRGMLSELGCDLEKTYFDVPRMRTAFPSDYLKAGIAYAFHPHRDTWYSAPFCQINWWMPIYEINSENCMAIHPFYWDHPVRNGSASYNYYKWNLESRQNAVKHVKEDTRVQPRPEEPMELDPQVRLVCDIGGAYQFSAAQMHSTVPNTSGLTRYSIDFRTVHLDDVLGRRGAPNIDSACSGTTLADYLRASDLSHLPQEAIALYLDGTESEYPLYRSTTERVESAISTR
ncbi:MAG TPA: hypothetical protein VGS27_13430 [Candidatus Sulfotelmatobacter sp.]|nr:hypothetical protein [Candidatus Sulfotelmatobacter sp.]